uniref:Fibronectin type-III domain-containing protein n=2 Tax=Trichobilharzia regenti TaxID=157069 RepID=A0AA85KC17_TRIRE|nr:unnamed protein product [Trichobilharzia regenti]
MKLIPWMLFTLTCVPTSVVGFPANIPADFSRNLLLRQLLNFQLPKDSSFESISSLSATSWNPTWSALFWTSWSKWELCTPDKQCTIDGDDKLTDTENFIYRTRICQFQSMNEHLLYSHKLIKGISLPNGMVPCSKEGLAERYIKKCPDLSQCINEDSLQSFSVEEQPKSSLETHSSKCEGVECDSMDKTEVVIATEKPSIIGRFIKHNQFWGPWIALQHCSAIIPTIDELPDEYPWESMLNFSRIQAGKRCQPGLQLQIRNLLSGTDITSHPQISQMEANFSPAVVKITPTTEMRKIHCWINEACPTSEVKVEPPITCVFQAIYRSPSVQVKWRRTPYGRIPSHFEVHVLDLINSVHYQESELHVEQIKLNKLDPWGENYITEVFGLKIGQPYQISIGSADEAGNIYFSKNCEAVVIIGTGDGSWSKWSNWSNCNSKCSSKLGTRSRHRKCNSPAPRNGGRMCPGSDQMHFECFGTDINC